jgi:hypothetical protein
MPREYTWQRILPADRAGYDWAEDADHDPTDVAHGEPLDRPWRSLLPDFDWKRAMPLSNRAW